MNGEGIGLASRERRWLLLLLVLYFLSGLFDHSLWGPNDCREGAMIADMVRNGEWVTPTLNGVSYLEKPPLLHWTGVVFCRAAGTVNEGLVRLPAALYGLGAVLLVWLWGRRMGRERAGLAAAFFCGTSFKFMEYSKIVLTDTCLSFMVMLSLFLFWGAYTATGRKGPRYAAFLLVSALSFYAKGLLGPGFVWVPVGLFLLFQRKWKLAVVLPLLFLPLFLLVVAPWAWALWKAGGMDFLRGVFWDNQVGRFITFSDASLPHDPYYIHKEAITYYLITLPGALLPWTLLVIPAMFRWFRRGQGLDHPLGVFMRFCVVGMLLILHASAAKVSIYALPLFPILFLMTAIWVEDAATRWETKLDRWPLLWTGWVLTGGMLLAPIAYGLLFVLPQSIRWKYLEHMDVVRDIGRPKAVFTALLAVALFGLVLFLVRRLRAGIRRGGRARVFLLMPAALAGAVMLSMAVVYPVYDFQRTQKPFAELLAREMAQGRFIGLALNEEKYIGAFTFYTGQRIPLLSTPRAIPRKLSEATGSTGFVVKTSDLEEAGEKWGLDAFPALKAEHAGYGSDKFRLLITDPI